MAFLLLTKAFDLPWSLGVAATPERNVTFCDFFLYIENSFPIIIRLLHIP